MALIPVSAVGDTQAEAGSLGLGRRCFEADVHRIVDIVSTPEHLTAQVFHSHSQVMTFLREECFQALFITGSVKNVSSRTSPRENQFMTVLPSCVAKTGG